jgi:hypothetical protein
VAEFSSSCDVVLSCLATDEAVLNIYKGADGAFSNAHRGSLVIRPEHEMQSEQGKEQDFSAVIMQMEKQASLSSTDKGRTRVGIASTEK